jgi:hypothetical protein
LLRASEGQFGAVIMAASWCPGLRIVSQRAAIRVSMDTDIGGPPFPLAFHYAAALHPVSGWA